MDQKNSHVYFEGKQGDVIWKSPVTSIHTQSKIYSQIDCDIIFLKNGSFVGLFDDNEEFYTLNHSKSSFLQRLFGVKESSAFCDIYYINKTVELENKWGTPTKIDIYDKDYDIYTTVGASGSYRFSVQNSLKLFSKVQGHQEKLDKDQIREFFRNELNVEIRNKIASFFLQYKLGIKDLALVTTLEKKVSENLYEELKSIFAQYGLLLTKFLIHQFIMEDEFIQQINNLKKQAIINNMKQDSVFEDKLKEAKNSVDIHELTREMHQELRSEDREDIKRASESIATINKSLPQIQSSENETTNNYKKFCSNCGSKISIDDKFCSNCGNRIQ